jgi:hypothetical protein
MAEDVGQSHCVGWLKKKMNGGQKSTVGELDKMN